MKVRTPHIKIFPPHQKEIKELESEIYVLITTISVLGIKITITRQYHFAQANKNSLEPIRDNFSLPIQSQYTILLNYAA